MMEYPTITSRRRGKPAFKHEQVVRRDLGTISIQVTESWGDVVIDGHRVHLTPGEGMVFQTLADYYGKMVPFPKLHERLGIMPHERPTLLRYIRSLRSKLSLYRLLILEEREMSGYMLMHYV